MLLLTICLVLVMTAADGQGALMSKISFALTGVWWFGFAHVTFNKMPVAKAKVLEADESIFSKGFGEIKSVMAKVKKTVRLRWNLEFLPPLRVAKTLRLQTYLDLVA